MSGYRWHALLFLVSVAIFVACGDDDTDMSPPSTRTVTPSAPTASPTASPPVSTPTAEPTVTPEPTPVNALTEEIIAAAQTYFSTSADAAFVITDPPECSVISELIDAGDATIDEFIGENLVCLIDPQFENGRVRVGFGPYASEVIGVLVLEETEDGGWRGITIEPGPQIEV